MSREGRGGGGDHNFLFKKATLQKKGGGGDTDRVHDVWKFFYYFYESVMEGKKNPDKERKPEAFSNSGQLPGPKKKKSPKNNEVPNQWIVKVG